LIVAVADGIVTHVVQHHDQGYCNEKIINNVNRVVIKHDNGLSSQYLHLLKNSSVVNVGDSVKQGQVIAKSGASGYVCSTTGGDGAHLHFQLQVSCGSYYCQSQKISFSEVNSCEKHKKVISQNNFNRCAEYKDVPMNNRYCNSISYAKERSIMQGYPDGSFFGDDKLINRAEFLKVVVKSANIPLQNFEVCFSDLESNTTWYTPYVCSAKRKGIIQGTEGGNSNLFFPDKHINYVEALKIALKAYGYEVNESLPSNTNWYDPYLKIASEKNIDQLSPDENVGRDFAAHLLCQIHEKIYLNNDGGVCNE